MKIRTKLLLFVLSSTLAIFASIIYLNYSTSRKTLVNEIERNAESMVDKYRLLLDSKLEDTTDVAVLEGKTIETLGGSLNFDKVKDLIKSYLSHYPEVYGSTISFLQGENDFGHTLFDAAKQFNSIEPEKAAHAMTTGKQGFVSLWNAMIGKQSWIVYGPLSTTGWSLGIVYPEDELLEDLRALHHKIVIIACSGIVLIFLIIFLISSHITRPIGDLVVAVKRVAGGDFFTEIKMPRSKDEIGMLAKAFSGMKNSLGSMMTQIREEKEMFAAAFTNMTDGLVILDANCNVLQFNRSAEKLLMLPAKGSMREHLSRNFEGELPFGNGEACTNERSTFKLSKKQVGDANVLHLECVVSPIVDDNGAVKEHVLNIRDITDQEVEERSKGDFLSLISHKFFTPLTVLQGKLMLLKDAGPLHEKQEKIVNSMADQTGKLNDLIGSLVSFVSLEGSKFDTKKDDLDLRSELNEVVVECKSWFTDKKPDIIVKVADELKKFSFNKNYFKLIIRRLVDNGIKFNMNTPPVILVDCATEGEYASFSVTDNGIGIPSEFHDKIFEKFYQIEKYYTGNVEGVGLGLAYVKTLVDTFKGKIDVRSEAGKGTTFKILLPNS